MLQAGGGPDLHDEPLGTQDGGELGLQHLEGDLAVVPQVVGQVDGGHAAFTQGMVDRVPTRQGVVQPPDHIRHEVARAASALT